MNTTKFKPILLVILMLLAGISVSAYAFESDGLYYNILSEKDRTVEVTHRYSQHNRGYVSGNIEIPRKVLYDKKTYTVTSIGEYAFQSCSGLTSVTIPNSVTSIGSGAFQSCSGLTSVTIPNSVTSIGSIAFCECYRLTSVTIPNSVTSIRKYAFEDCSGLTSVTIPNSVTSIGYGAFCECNRLTSVTIGNSVTSIGSDAFQGCSSLGTIYVQSQVPVECAPSFPDDVIKNAILYVPTGTLAAYEKVDPWRNFWNIEEMDFGGFEETAVDDREPQISIDNGIIRIRNSEGNPLVEVFDISGKNVFRGNDTTVSGLANGIYIVKVGANVMKVRL